MGVDHLSMMSWHTYAKGYHHKRNLRDGGEGENSLDVALGASHGSGIESGEHSHPYNNTHLTRGILNPQGEETGYLEHTGNNHRGGVDESTDGGRTFHGIGQPDVQGEHGRLTGTTDEHQYEGCGKDESACGYGLGCVNGQERGASLCHLQVLDK